MLVGSNDLFAAETAPTDPRVAQIVSKTIAVDMHNHVQIRLTKNPAAAIPDLDIDLSDELKRSGLSAICQTYGLDGVGGVEPGNDETYYLQTLAFEDRLLQHSHIWRALNLKDLETAHAQKQPIVIQAVEGAHFVEGRLERVEQAYGRGLRHLQILHERDNSTFPLGDVYTAPAHLGGLTAFGAQVIKECNRLGIVVDLAHGTGESVLGALKAATQPMIVSHTSLSKDTDSADMRRRLISKEVASAVADAGGVVGVWWRMCTTTKEYVESIKTMLDAIGIDHVGIGTDSDLTASYSLPYTNKIYPDMNGGFFFAVAAEMLRQGFAPEEISKIGGGNFCRVFGQVTAKYA
jgi:membrane dipeptidase